MIAAIIPFEPGAALARIDATLNGWQIDCRGPNGARHYDFASAGAAAEFAILLRDEGGWLLRFGAGTEVVRALIAELGE